MRYRKLDDNGDMVFGGDQAAFYVNVPEAPAQAVLTRLYLFLGEWFLDITDGTPWRTRVLGKYTGSTRDATIRARILTTPAVNAITAYGSQLNRDTRQYNVQTTIDTAYGRIALAGVIPEPQ